MRPNHTSEQTDILQTPGNWSSLYLAARKHDGTCRCSQERRTHAQSHPSGLGAPRIEEPAKLRHDWLAGVLAVSTRNRVACTFPFSACTNNFSGHACHHLHCMLQQVQETASQRSNITWFAGQLSFLTRL